MDEGTVVDEGEAEGGPWNGKKKKEKKMGGIISECVMNVYNAYLTYI